MSWMSEGSRESPARQARAAAPLAFKGQACAARAQVAGGKPHHSSGSDPGNLAECANCIWHSPRAACGRRAASWLRGGQHAGTLLPALAEARLAKQGEQWAAEGTDATIIRTLHKTAVTFTWEQLSLAWFDSGLLCQRRGTMRAQRCDVDFGG